MKKGFKFLIVGSLAGALAGCGFNQEINYDNKPYKISVLEEKIEDKIERENPGLNVEVSIAKEAKSKKKKKKRL